MPTSFVLSSETEAFNEALGVGGLGAALDFLNTRTAYRFTLIYKSEPPDARRIMVHDRDALYISGRDLVPISHTHFEFMSIEPAFSTEDGLMDERCRLHPCNQHFRAFCGISMLCADGQLYGWLAHASPGAVAVPPGETEFLHLVAPALMQVLEAMPSDFT